MDDAAYSLAKKVILIIDDEPRICETVADIVQMFDGTAIGVTTLDPEKVYFRGHVDLIIVDLMLTGRHNGVELADHLQARGYTGPVIAMSASDQMLELARADGHFAALVRKPFDMPTLIATMVRAMEGHPC